eukprot:133901-Pleurochrysis_carterae.AAC.2
MSVASGARFRREAKAGGVAQAATILARMDGVSAGPSATRPLTTSPRPGGPRAAISPPSTPCRSIPAMIAFISSAGYAAAPRERGAPSVPRPYAISSCPSVP